MDGQARYAPMPVIEAVLEGGDVAVKLAAVGGLGGVACDALGLPVDRDREELRPAILDNEEARRGRGISLPSLTISVNPAVADR